MMTSRVKHFWLTKNSPFLFFFHHRPTSCPPSSRALTSLLDGAAVASSSCDVSLLSGCYPIAVFFPLLPPLPPSHSSYVETFIVYSLPLMMKFHHLTSWSYYVNKEDFIYLVARLVTGQTFASSPTLFHLHRPDPLSGHFWRKDK